MALFKNPLVIHHRVAAAKLRDFVLSKEVSEYEHAFAETVGAKEYRYLAERTYLLASLTKYLLHLRGEATKNNEVRAASGFFERLLNEYFASRPGIDGNVSTFHWHLAREEYLQREVPSLASTFLTRVGTEFVSAEQIPSHPRCLDLVSSHVSSASKAVLDATANL